jgi:hypothetical protein
MNEKLLSCETRLPDLEHGGRAAEIGRGSSHGHRLKLLGPKRISVRGAGPLATCTYPY